LHPLQMRTLMEVDQLATVMGMVRAGLGVSIVPSLTLFHFRHPDVVTRPLSWPGFTRHIYMVRRRDRGLSLAAQSLHDWMLHSRPHIEATEGPRRARRSKAAHA
jgi:LysR family carnitine catabolism transcriptional activator